MADNPVRPRRDTSTLEARRMAALPRLQRGDSLSSIARQLGLRRRPPPGRPTKLARARLAQLPRLLAPGAEAYGFSSPLWTTPRVADLIGRRFGVRYDRDHVCRLLHRFGWTWQKPARRARERDEAALQRWVKHTWPRLKKKPKS